MDGGLSERRATVASGRSRADAAVRRRQISISRRCKAHRHVIAGHRGAPTPTQTRSDRGHLHSFIATRYGRLAPFPCQCTTRSDSMLAASCQDPWVAIKMLSWACFGQELHALPDRQLLQLAVMIRVCLGPACVTALQYLDARRCGRPASTSSDGIRPKRCPDPRIWVSRLSFCGVSFRALTD